MTESSALQEWTSSSSQRPEEERIAVVNRGDAAVRLIHAVRELNLEQGSHHRTIAFHTDEEATAPLVELADESYGLGPARDTASDGSDTLAYLSLAKLAEALRATGATAAWVGWGFVSENPEFAELCEELGVLLIGPSSSVMRALGDKVVAKQLAESVAVPVVPWNDMPVRDVSAAQAAAESIGYPVMLKAAAGGGGRGIRVVTGPSELQEAFVAAAREATAAFGDSSLFVEKRIERARHVEVQIAADEYGGVLAVGTRDCTVQRRRQKVLEESGMPGVAEDVVASIRAAAVRLIRASGYTGVGTVEFLLEPGTGEFYFIEVNTRLQVEHTVTEEVTGLDLIKLQLGLSWGSRVPPEPPAEHGSALEVRVTAENPLHGFRPAPGLVEVWEPATGPGLRFDSGTAPGVRIPPEFDPLAVKIIARGADRAEALARLRRALEDTRLVIRRGASGLGFLRTLLARPEIAELNYTTRWLDDLVALGEPLAPDHRAAALMLAAVELSDHEWATASNNVLVNAGQVAGTPSNASGRRVELTLDGVTYRPLVHRVEYDRYHLETPDGVVGLQRLWARNGTVLTRIGSEQVRAHLGISEGSVQVDLGGNTYQVQTEDVGVVRAHAPSVVVGIRVEPGMRVHAGDPVLVLESMKLETVLPTPTSGIVRDVWCRLNTQVDTGASLVRIEPDPDAGQVADKPVSFSALCGSENDRERSTELHGALRRLRGFDSGAEIEGTEPPVTRLDQIELLRWYALSCWLDGPLGYSETVNGYQVSTSEAFALFLRSVERSRETLPDKFLTELGRTLAAFGSPQLTPGPELEIAVYRMWRARRSLSDTAPVVRSVLHEWLMTDGSASITISESERAVLEELAATATWSAGVGDLAWAVLRRHSPPSALDVAEPGIAEALRALEADRPERVEQHTRDLLVNSRHDADRWIRSNDHLTRSPALMEVLVRRLYRRPGLRAFEPIGPESTGALIGTDERVEHADQVLVVPLVKDSDASVVRRLVEKTGAPYLELVVPPDTAPATSDEALSTLITACAGRIGGGLKRVVLTTWDHDEPSRHLSVRGDGYSPEWTVLHPEAEERFELWRLRNFSVELLASGGDLYLLSAIAGNDLEDRESDRRLIALAEVENLTYTDNGPQEPPPELEETLLEALEMIRDQRAKSSTPSDFQFNRVVLYVRPPWTSPLEQLAEVSRRLAPVARNLGIATVIARLQTPDSDGTLRERVVHLTGPTEAGVRLGTTEPSPHPMRPLSPRQRRLQRLHRRGLRDPYEIIDLLISRDTSFADFPPGKFHEYDLDDNGDPVRVERPAGGNSAGVVIGIIENTTREHPDGMTRVAILSDPARGLGSLAEAECRRVLAALKLARGMEVPVEWFSVSSGARVAMDSGTENMDWVARVLREIVRFTQDGGEVNIIVSGVNVGAQPYFNAEATMLMHTKGVLIMTPASAMVLTGKEALDFAGGVSAEDNLAIGGHSRIMGPNGQAQLWAPTFEGACQLLFDYYERTYVSPGAAVPPKRITTDPVDRDIRTYPHPELADCDFATVGDIFSQQSNPERKKPFDMRTLMRAVADSDCEPQERWSAMAEAESSIVWETRIGGFSAMLLGIESRQLARKGPIPSDGPQTWSAATLFPRSSKKLARALNSASGRRPVVILANLAGFDGSPESLRELQLEYGAEIGRAVVNFSGPLLFCVVSRYHGGAFVVFSKSLNPDLEVIAVSGARASVIGGSAAASVVFAKEVETRVSADPRVTEARGMRTDSQHEKDERDAVVDSVRAEVRAELALEFDTVHDIDRAKQVGSVDRVVDAGKLRPEIIATLTAKADAT